MSTGRGGDRRREGRRGHLVLVGAPDRAAPDDADWDAFCTRIGWQRPETTLPDDYEERLLARVFADDSVTMGTAPPNLRAEAPAGVAVEQALREAQIALAARIAAGADETRPWRRSSRGESRADSRRAPAAWAMMAVAAVLCVAASAVLWRGARPALDAQACPDVETSRRANIAPIDDRAAPLNPTEPRRATDPPSRRLQTKDAPATPAPTAAKPQKPVAPGTLVARRRRRDDAWRRRAVAPLRIAEAPGPLVTPVRIAPAQPRDLDDEPAGIASPLAAADLQGPAPKLTLPDARPGPGGVTVAAQTLPVIPRAWPETRAPETWTQPASFHPAPVSAGWSLSSESPRWYGVGLPPSSAPTGVPSGLGVIGQLDVTKALSKL